MAFMLLLGTFLGVWNPLAISSHHAANSVSAGRVQAHGHAQIFGWIGTFILGIGFYSIPNMQKEEQILFPYIDTLERAANADSSVEPAFFKP